MKIELKNIRHFETLSEETNAFTASVYIEGKRVGTAENTGKGGETFVRANDNRGRDLIDRAETYFKGLPPKHYPGSGGSEGFSLQLTLSSYIDDLLTEHLIQKDLDALQAKLKKAMEKGIVFGVPDGNGWYIQTYAVPFSEVLNHPNAPNIIANTIAKKIFSDLKDGVKILNTNIPESILKMAGLSSNQYVSPMVADVRTNYPSENIAENSSNSRKR